MRREPVRRAPAPSGSGRRKPQAVDARTTSLAWGGDEIAALEYLMRRQVEEKVAAASSLRPLGLGAGGRRGAGTACVRRRPRSTGRCAPSAGSVSGDLRGPTNLNISRRTSAAQGKRSCGEPGSKRQHWCEQGEPLGGPVPL